VLIPEITSENLVTKIVRLEKENQVLRNELLYKDEVIKFFRRQIFVSKSEKTEPTQIAEQMGLFNEAESEVTQNPSTEQQKLIHIEAHDRQKPVRKPLSKELPRKEVVIELPESERCCEHDGQRLVEIGQEVTEQIDVVPASVLVIKIIRKKYACPKCDGTIKVAALPAQPIPKSNASPGLLAYVATSKYMDHLPLYRQEQMLARYGLELSRQTLADWMIRCGELVSPVVNILREELISETYLQGDETRVQVLKEDGRKPQAQSYMWVVARNGPKPLVFFSYEKSRSGKVPLEIFSGFKGNLQVDGYGGYNVLVSREGIIRLGCMAHIRRKFFSAAKVGNFGNVGKRALDYIQALYKIEAQCKAMSTDNRYQYRQQMAQPILDKLYSWIQEQMRRVPPQSVAGRALAYAYREWGNVIHYLDDGRFHIDNNFIENLIRPFALGRKNWMFADTEKGAEASANLYSLVISAKLNGLDPYKYLKAVFSRLPAVTTAEEITALLPDRIQLD